MLFLPTTCSGGTSVSGRRKRPLIIERPTPKWEIAQSKTIRKRDLLMSIFALLWNVCPDLFGSVPPKTAFNASAGGSLRAPWHRPPEHEHHHTLSDSTWSRTAEETQTLSCEIKHVAILHPSQQITRQLEKHDDGFAFHRHVYRCISWGHYHWAQGMYPMQQADGMPAIFCLQSTLLQYYFKSSDASGLEAMHISAVGSYAYMPVPGSQSLSISPGWAHASFFPSTRFFYTNQ